MSMPRDSRAVSPVVAVILLIAITVVLTAVLYAVVTSIAQQIQDPAPRIFLAAADEDPDTTLVAVIGVSTEMPTHEFLVRLLVDGIVDPNGTMPSVAAGTAGRITFEDRDGGGTLSQGDRFLVEVEAGHAYEFLLFWRGTLAHSVTWEI